MLVAFLVACASHEPVPPVCSEERTELATAKPVTGGVSYWCQRKNGTHQGPWVEYRDDGSKSAEGVYDRGRRQGTFTWYWPNGKKMAEAEYKDGKRNGVRVEYDEAGAETKRETWEDDVLVPPSQ